MIVGDIYYFESNQARGYVARNKYHVYLGEGTFPLEGHVFLYINKSAIFEGYKITNFDYKFFPLEESYIDCGSVVEYHEHDLHGIKIERKGTLLRKHVQELHDAIAASETMVRRHIPFVCDALRSLLLR